MNEEIKRPEAELSEAALEDVSGGYKDDPNVRAARSCMICIRSRECGHKTKDLGAYLREHPEVSIINPPRCPYYYE